MAHKARKRFGQHFLHDARILQHFLVELALSKDELVVEIGPGQGALTEYLLKYLPSISAIEIDRDLQALLRHRYTDRINLVEGDALEVDYSQFGSHFRVVGNLPYNISTPILFYLLRYKHVIQDMHFMLQKEVVERLASPVGCKDYGRLSVVMQYYFEIEHLFDVLPESFDPPPRVDSAVVRLTPRLQSPFPVVVKEELESVVQQAFAMRRKTLANNLKPLISASELENLGINPGLRPEQLTVNTFAVLTNHLSSRLKLK